MQWLFSWDGWSFVQQETLQNNRLKKYFEFLQVTFACVAKHLMVPRVPFNSEFLLPFVNHCSGSILIGPCGTVSQIILSQCT